jgi:hypothetical protein
VAHPHFGEGVVVAVEPRGSGRTAEWYVTVSFHARGRVTLLAGVAPLERLA